MKEYFCYFLKNTSEKYKNYTYCGFTDNPKRRIRQHNEEIKGGAKATKGKNNSWEYLMLLGGFKTSNNALSCEWRMKHPDNQRKKSKKYSGISGRIKTLNEILLLLKWTDKCDINNDECKYQLFVDDEIKNELVNIPEYIEIKNLKECEKIHK
jgi:structure-specific endonuclease subunit SLX1